MFPAPQKYLLQHPNEDENIKLINLAAFDQIRKWQSNKEDPQCVKNESVLRITVGLDSPIVCSIALFVSHTRTHTHTLHILSLVCDEMTRWGAPGLFLLSGQEQQCSVDPFRQNSTIHPHQKLPRNSPWLDRGMKKIEKRKERGKIWSLCATV